MEIERRGHEVLRLAIRRSDVGDIDPLDLEESENTIHCLSLPIWRHLYALLRLSMLSPIKLLASIKLSIDMGLKSHRGVIAHFGYLLEATTLLSVIYKERIQHIHAHFGTNSAAVARLIKCLGGPGYSFTVHGPTEFDAAIGFDLKGKIKDSSSVIAITDYCSAQLRRWCPPKEWDKIHIVHCTVGDDFFSPVQPVNPDCRNFVSIGRLSAQKGQHILIDAFAQIINKGYDAKLIFVGDGEMRDSIEQLIRSHKIQHRVTITGFVPEDEVRKYIADSRAMVLPSFAEGLPMVIMEAFAIGRPVISTYVAGIPELVIPGENGWLVPAGNTDRLALALIEALEAPGKQLLEMANRGRELTSQLHSTVIEGEKLEKILLGCLETLTKKL